jgi:hypothetical protein
MYVGNVNTNPHRNKLNPTSEKNAENSYSGGRFSMFENEKSIRIVAGITNTYPMIKPKTNKPAKDNTNGSAAFLSFLCSAGFMNL